MTDIIEILNRGDYVCVVKNKGRIRTFTQRGVRDLYELLTNEPDFLKGAYVADKVVGKASAALMIAGGVKKIYTRLISKQALDLLKDKDIEIEYDKEVPVIINRDQTDWCPMEKLCYKENSIENILKLVSDFLNKSKLKTVALFLLGMTLSFSTSGQEKSDSLNTRKTISLDEVTVTGTRYETDIRHLPLSISVVSRDQIKNSQQQSLLPLLNEQVPGLFITGRGIMGYGVANGAAGTMSLRGVGGQPTTGLLVLIDGEPQYMGLMGHPMADTYQSLLAERVEVVRGPASVLYGSNAMGGVINIVTSKVKKDTVTSNAGISYGSYNTLQSSVSNTIRKDGFSSKVAASYNRTDGHRQDMDFNQWNGFAKLGYDMGSQWNITYDLNLSRFNASNPGTVDALIIDNDAEITRGMTSLAIENHYHQTSGALKFYYNWGQHKINDGYPVGEEPLDDRFRSRDKMTGISWYQSATLFPNNRVTVGVDYQYFGGEAWNESTENTNKVTLTDTTLYETAAYLSIRQSVGSRLTLDAGLRYDHHSKTGTQWIPQAGMALHLPNTMVVKANASKGFRNPTIRELFMFPPQNPDLKPESIMNYEISLSQHLSNHRLYYGLNLFYLEGDNMIQTIFSDGRPLNVNSGEIKNQGIEATFSYAINQKWSTNANYSWLNMEHPVVASPRHKVFAEVILSQKKYRISNGIQYINGLYTSVEPDQQENFILWNVKADYRLNPLISFFVNGENLLAQEYEINEGYPMPKATFMTGININF
ncbi:TonB-dependent receptor domain-containing protein [Thermophagus sp. OGC60D27]|uniref:TonB-dependent receptor domain-containing protein n=1 Tax=Thermophagus sp. OGC60D27 TaxID=3458415 RepID=UPI0040378831